MVCVSPHIQRVAVVSEQNISEKCFLTIRYNIFHKKTVYAALVAGLSNAALKHHAAYKPLCEEIDRFSKLYGSRKYSLQLDCV